MPEMSGAEFVEEMHATLWQILAVRDAALARLKEAVTRGNVPQLLLGALRAEMEAAEIAARWMPGTADLEVRLAFARQSGDEARHYMVISKRLESMGVSLAGFDPLAGGHSKLFRYLDTLGSTVERVAAAQFAREAIGHKSNELFIAFCEEAQDHETAEMYRNEIQPDEKRHHEWGSRLLARLASTGEAQAAARKAILTTLELAEELRSLAAGQLLVETVPGC